MVAGFERHSRKKGQSPESCRSARPRTSQRARRHRGSSRRSRVELPREESCSALQDLVGSAEFLVLPFELDDSAALFGREAGLGATVDLGLGNPVAKRLVPDAELAGDTTDGSGAFAGLLDGLEDHPDGAFLQLRRITLGTVVLAVGVVWHGSILQEMESPSKPGRTRSSSS